MLHYMETITHREYEAWQAYLDEEWNRPSRTDNYLMLIAYYVANVLSKKAKKFSSKSYTLSFGGRPKKPKRQTPEVKAQAVRSAKSRWFGMLGFGGKK